MPACFNNAFFNFVFLISSCKYIAKIICRFGTFNMQILNQKIHVKSSRPLREIRINEPAQPMVELSSYPREAHGQLGAAAPGHPEADHANHLPDVVVPVRQPGQGAPAVPPAGGLAGLKGKCC